MNVLRVKFESLQYSYDTLTLSYEQVIYRFLLKNAAAHFNATKKKVNQIAVLLQLENEKKEMQRKLISEFLDFQQKAVYQNVIFEQKISELKKVVESKEAQIIDLIIGNSENNFIVNPKNMQVIDINLGEIHFYFLFLFNNDALFSLNFIQDVLNAKNEKISTLTAELSTLMKTHNDIIQNYKAAIRSDSTYTE